MLQGLHRCALFSHSVQENPDFKGGKLNGSDLHNKFSFSLCKRIHHGVLLWNGLPYVC